MRPSQPLAAREQNQPDKVGRECYVVGTQLEQGVAMTKGSVPSMSTETGKTSVWFVMVEL